LLDSAFSRQPVHLEVVSRHAQMMVSQHQASSLHLRLVLSHMHVGDHISFVAADAEGCYGAAAASYNMTATFLAAVRDVLTIHVGCSR
jgi:hypothetical protein